MSHACETIVVTCMDYRLQRYINQWIEKNCQANSFDRVSWAGSIKSLDAVMQQIEVSHRLHHTKNVIIINHEDCGAYGKTGTREKHLADLKAAKIKIQQQFPELNINTSYLHLDGTFEAIA